MRQKASVSFTVGFSKASPLEKVHLPGVAGEIYLKREDLLQPAGGNKVRRLEAWFGRHPNAHTVVAMSDPGAHTFKVVQAFRNTAAYTNRIRRVVFLETLRKTNPYSQSIRNEYLADTHVNVFSGPAVLQIPVLKLLGFFPGVAALGVGGHVQVSPNPFAVALREVNGYLSEKNPKTERTTHLFPIASGTMLDGFLEENANMDRNRFVGVMTGNPLTNRLLTGRYRRNLPVVLKPARHVSWSEYREKARWFHANTGVWLDPVHTIHLLDYLEEESREADRCIVFWITCPLIDHEPALWGGGL